MEHICFWGLITLMKMWIVETKQVLHLIVLLSLKWFWYLISNWDNTQDQVPRLRWPIDGGSVSLSTPLTGQSPSMRGIGLNIIQARNKILNFVSNKKLSSFISLKCKRNPVLFFLLKQNVKWQSKSWLYTLMPYKLFMSLITIQFLFNKSQVKFEVERGT